MRDWFPLKENVMIAIAKIVFIAFVATSGAIYSATVQTGDYTATIETVDYSAPIETVTYSDDYSQGYGDYSQAIRPLNDFKAFKQLFKRST